MDDLGEDAAVQRCKDAFYIYLLSAPIMRPATWHCIDTC